MVNLGGEEVRIRTHAPRGVFRAEAMIPRLSPDNAPQNWCASSIDELWDRPTSAAVADALRVGDEVSRRLACLGRGGIVEASRLPGISVWAAWGANKACQAHHRGFIEKLAHDPKATVLAIVHGPGTMQPRPAYLRPAPEWPERARLVPRTGTS